MPCPSFTWAEIAYAFFGIMAGAPTFLTREPEAAALIGAVKAGATHAFFVPPVIARFLDAGEAAINAISGLRYLVYGAAPMPMPLLQRALDAWPADELRPGVRADGTVRRGSPRSTPKIIAIPLGSTCCCRPERRCRATRFGWSIPESGEQVPAGEPGEIWVRSNQRMSGYLNRAQATAETITADDWLRTGDIGRLDADGYLYIEDRLKDMIITGGENVYGPEVESVLIEHPAVADAAVIGVPDDFWGESVKAIVVTTTEIEPDEIIEFCRRHLAGYKCPRTVDFVPSLPRNASGKILKTELREPYWQDRARRV